MFPILLKQKKHENDRKLKNNKNVSIFVENKKT